MKAHQKKHAKYLMNHFGTSGVPFFFLTDFLMTQIYVIPVSEIDPKRIMVSMPKFTNFIRNPHITSINSFEIYPVSYKEYYDAFMKVQKEIRAGNSYLLNLTFPSRILTNVSLSDIFYLSSAPYKLLFDNQFVVFSPEIFVRINDGQISSFPMKGTIDASIPDAEKIILNDYKETAEHNTIVDLIRSDLSAVAKKVRVSRFRYIDHIQTTRKNLLQVSSEISGELENGYESRIGDIIFSLLPAGSVTGAPKKKTVEIISNAEGYERGFYTGVFGFFDGKNLDSAVSIRFIEQTKNGDLFYKSGGGITTFSNPENEYKELIDKVYVPVT